VHLHILKILECAMMDGGIASNSMFSGAGWLSHRWFTTLQELPTGVLNRLLNADPLAIISLGPCIP
jgi:hypothetical protein